jgi:hypothetical protein
VATRGNAQASFCFPASTVIALRIPIIGIAGISPSAKGINSNCDLVGGDSDVSPLNVSAPVGTRVTAADPITTLKVIEPARNDGDERRARRGFA